MYAASLPAKLPGRLRCAEATVMPCFVRSIAANRSYATWGSSADMNCGDSWDTNLVLEGHQTIYTLNEAISSGKVQSLSALVSVASASEEDGITFLGHSVRRTFALVHTRLKKFVESPIEPWYVIEGVGGVV
jgi:hypothetical protein